MASPSSESRLLASIVCLTCGDKGDEGFLIYCIKCQDSATHLYCLDDFSSNDGQNVWRCWDCAPKIDKVESPRKSERIRRKTDKAIEVRMNLEKKLYPRSSCRARKFVPANHGMVDTDHLTGYDSPPVMEIKKSSDGIDSNMELLDCGSESSYIDARNSADKFDKDEAALCPLTSDITDIGFSSARRLDFEMTGSAQIGDDSSTLIDRTNIFQPFAEQSKDQDFRKRRRRRLMVDDSSSSEEECPTIVEDTSFSSEPQCQLFAQSLKYPIWRGCFSITCAETETSLGILAHLSKKACSNVSERTIVLPPVLAVELITKQIVWPKRFQSSPPTDASIDLYFFPEYERDENVFDVLLDDMIEGDHALKVMIKDLELLIFSSRELPLENWRFQLKYYLWGVFE